VLVQSFMWADKLKDEEARAEAQAAAGRFTSAMSAEPEVSLEHLFAARQGTAVIHCDTISALPPCHSAQLLEIKGWQVLKSAMRGKASIWTLAGDSVDIPAAELCTSHAGRGVQCKGTARVHTCRIQHLVRARVCNVSTSIMTSVASLLACLLSVLVPRN